MPMEVEADDGGVVFGEDVLDGDGAGDKLFNGEVDDPGAVIVAGEKVRESEKADGGIEDKRVRTDGFRVIAKLWDVQEKDVVGGGRSFHLTGPWIFR